MIIYLIEFISELHKTLKVSTPRSSHRQDAGTQYKPRLPAMLPQYTRWRAGRETAPYKERQAGDRRDKTRPVGLNDAVFDGFYGLDQCQTLYL